MKAMIRGLIQYEKGSYWLISTGVLCVLMVLFIGAVSLGNAYRLQNRIQKAAEYVAVKCGEQAVEITRYRKGSKEQTAVMDQIARDAIKEYFKGEEITNEIEFNHLIMKADGKINIALSLYHKSMCTFIFGWGNNESHMDFKRITLKGKTSITINKD